MAQRAPRRDRRDAAARSLGTEATPAPLPEGDTRPNVPAALVDLVDDRFGTPSPRLRVDPLAGPVRGKACLVQEVAEP